MLPMTLGVFLVNYALDLWSFTKTTSPLLLLANALIIVLHRQRVAEIFKLLLTAITRRRYGWIEVAINICIIAFMSRKLFTPLYHGKYTASKPFCGDCFNHHPNEWVLIQESIKDSILPSQNLKCYFTPRGVYSEINDYNKSTDYLMYKVDEKNFFT